MSLRIFYKYDYAKSIMGKTELGMKRRLKTLKRIEKYVAGREVLDVGCNSGVTTRYFSEKGFETKGIDLDKKWIDFARSGYPVGKFEVKDILDEKGKYNTILMIGVLEEIPIFPEKVLRQLKKNLKRGGRIIIEVRNMNSAKRRFKTLFGLEPVDSFYGRLWCFTKKRLEKIIIDAGYDILEVTSNKWESLRSKTVPTPDSLSEEIWAVIIPKKG